MPASKDCQHTLRVLKGEMVCVHRWVCVPWGCVSHFQHIAFNALLNAEILWSAGMMFSLRTELLRRKAICAERNNRMSFLPYVCLIHWHVNVIYPQRTVIIVLFWQNLVWWFLFSLFNHSISLSLHVSSTLLHHCGCVSFWCCCGLLLVTPHIVSLHLMFCGISEDSILPLRQALLPSNSYTDTHMRAHAVSHWQPTPLAPSC